MKNSTNTSTGSEEMGTVGPTCWVNGAIETGERVVLQEEEGVG